MKETATALAEFLNDFIGHVVPGSIFLMLLLLFFNWPLQIHEDVLASFSFMFAYVAVSYGVGQMLSAIHAFCIPLLKTSRLAIDEEKWEAAIEASGQGDAARTALANSGNRLTGRDLRSALMTRSPQAQRLAVRFQHIAHMYSGIAFALCAALSARLYAYNVSPELLRVAPSKIDVTVQSLTMLIVSICALRKGMEFHRRSLRIPLSAGVTEIQAAPPPQGP